jgi:hypothetical protein
VFVFDGKGGHSRLIPISDRFFATVARYLEEERPSEVSTGRVFVVLKGPNRGQPLTPKGLEQIIRGGRQRAGLSHATCHELRHACLTRLREAGMSLEAVQAQAGLEMTMTYARIADRTVADEYFAVTDQIENLYTNRLDPEAEGPNMRRLRAEHQRMLGNGWCNRPALLDCAFESICETCVHFAVAIEFAPTLQRQHDHAAEHDQPQRAALFSGILERLHQGQQP